jgi:NADPH:quinone reductase-like Zn-dependent oxidoreductase
MTRPSRALHLTNMPRDLGGTLMKAIVWTAYGPPDALQLREVERPTPKEDEVLIKIHATTVTAGDCEMRSLKFPLWLSLPMRAYAGFRRPKRITILGQELAGEIEAVGKDVKLFKEGDQVFASTGFGTGTYCEYVCLPEEPGEMDGVLAIKPANMTYDEAAAVPVGGLEALHFLRKADIQSGQKVLINGSGGSIGTFGVQLAKYFGAEVTAVDSAGKLDMLRSIGADHVIDYTQEDFTKSGETYDVIFDVVGKAPYSGSIGSLEQNGFYLVANPRLSLMLRGRWTSMTGSKTVISQVATHKTEDLVFLKERIEAGRMKTVIDRRYPLEETAEAHRYVEKGGKKGNVIITVEHSSKT